MLEGLRTRRRSSPRWRGDVAARKPDRSTAGAVSATTKSARGG